MINLELTYMVYLMMGEMPDNGYKLAVMGPENGGGLYDPFGKMICDFGKCAEGLPYLEMTELAHQTFGNNTYSQIFFAPIPENHLLPYALLSRVNVGDSKLTLAVNMNHETPITMNDVICDISREELNCSNYITNLSSQAIGTFDLTLENLDLQMNTHPELFWNNEFVTYYINF